MKGKNIKKLVFTLLTFFIFGVINVNAETVMVDSESTFTKEFKNVDSTSDVIVLAKNIDMSAINYNQQLFIYKDKTIDLNGNTLILPNFQLALVYNANATVKFIDSSLGKTGKIIGADDSTGDNPLIRVSNTNTTEYTETYLVFNGVRIERANGQIISTQGNAKISKTSFIDCNIINFDSLVDTRATDKVYLENITFTSEDKPFERYLINSSELTIKDVISEDCEVVKISSAGEIVENYEETTILENVSTYANNTTLKVRYKDGFTVSNVNLKETLGYTSSTSVEIPITNRGTSNLTIESVSVDDISKFEIIPGNKTDLEAGKTDKSWKIKARDGINAGTYKAVITVTGSNTKTYTGEVTLEVEEYEDGYKTIYVTSFDELKDAIDGVKYNSEGIKVTDTSIRKVKLGANIIIPDKKSLRFNIINDFVLDLNGYTIDGYTYDRTIMLAYGNNGYENFDSGSLTIIDSSSSQSGTINLGTGAIEIQQFNINDNDKNYKLIIDGGKYYQKYGQEHYFINIDNNSNYYWKDKKISFDFKVNKGYFEFEGSRGKLLLAQSFVENEQNVNLNISFERLTLKGKNSYLLYANDKDYTLNEVLGEGSDLYVLNKDNKQKLITNKDISAITYVPGNEYATGDSDFEYGLYEGIKVAKQQGFIVTAPTFDKVEYGYSTVTPKAISITNVGESALKIENVTVSSSETEAKFAFNTGSTSTLNPNQVDASWMIYPVAGLSAGTHEAVITVTDDHENTYTTTVTFVVEPKELTELGVGGVGSTIEYGTDYTPTLTGTTELGSGDYTIKYAQKDGETYIDLGDSKPTGIGDYKVTISITNENYKQIEVSTTYAIVPKEIEPSVGYIAPESYTGSEITPDVTVWNGASMLTKDDDYTFEYANNTNAGKAKVIVKPVVGSRYTFTNVEKEFDILPKSIKDDSISVTLENTSYKFTGGEIEPKPVVKDGEKLLVKDDDYELYYNNNTNICDNTASVEVIGRGNYKESVTKYFSIIAKETQTISFDETSVTKTYGDSSFTKKANLTTGDGTIKYTSSNTDVAEVNEISGLVTIKGAGTAVITATASETDTYGASTATYTLTVAKKEIEIERASVISKEYDGTKTAEVDYIIFKGLSYGETLAKDVDYTATAEFDSANVGYSKPVTVKVVLNDTAKANNYSFRDGLPNAEIQTRARIRGKVIKESWVTVDTTTTYTYNGSAHTPNIFVKDGSTTLEKDRDYTVEYTDNTNAGTGNIKVIGIGNYDNEASVVEKTFTIERKEVILQISDISPVTYNGSKHTPLITVKDKDTGDLLENDTDYTLSYGTNTDAGSGEIIIRSKASSNYTFGETTKTFTINRYSIFSNDVTLEYTSTVYNGTDKRPTVTLKFNGNVIPSSDYSVSYADNKEVGTAKAIVTIDTTNFTGTVEKTFEIVNKTLLTINGISNQEVTYTGSPVVLTGNLTVSNGISPSSLTEKWYKDGTEISKPTNVGVYKVVYSYEDHDYIGKLEVTVEITKKTSTVPSINPKSGVASDKLSSITLPNGFKWVDENETIIAGNKEYNATYTENNDTTNYTTKNLTITVYGKSKVNLTTSVNGIGGLISSSKTNILEGTTEEVKFTPSTGFEISKVLVNGVDKTSSIVNNKLNIVVGASDMDVVVTYKLIQYTITINNVANATIEPSGIIKVDYNSNKEFTIKADIGYKLVSVKVNDVEKLSNIINDKLTLENILADAKIVVVVERNLYEVIEGANQKYTITKDTEARFKFNAEYSKFESNGKVYIDDELLDSSNYISESGSTIITLKKEYVDTLSEGTHKIKVLFVDGEASTTFIVNKITNESNPSTGDNIVKYIITGIISLLGICASGAYIYKIKKTK